MMTSYGARIVVAALSLLAALSPLARATVTTTAATAGTCLTGDVAVYAHEVSIRLASVNTSDPSGLLVSVELPVRVTPATDGSSLSFEVEANVQATVSGLTTRVAHYVDYFVLPPLAQWVVDGLPPTTLPPPAAMMAFNFSLPARCGVDDVFLLDVAVDRTGNLAEPRKDNNAFATAFAVSALLPTVVSAVPDLKGTFAFDLPLPNPVFVTLDGPLPPGVRLEYAADAVPTNLNSAPDGYATAPQRVYTVGAVTLYEYRLDVSMALFNRANTGKLLADGRSLSSLYLWLALPAAAIVDPSTIALSANESAFAFPAIVPSTVGGILTFAAAGAWSRTQTVKAQLRRLTFAFRVLDDLLRLANLATGAAGAQADGSSAAAVSAASGGAGWLHDPTLPASLWTRRNWNPESRPSYYTLAAAVPLPTIGSELPAAAASALLGGDSWLAPPNSPAFAYGVALNLSIAWTFASDSELLTRTADGSLWLAVAGASARFAVDRSKSTSAVGADGTAAAWAKTAPWPAPAALAALPVVIDVPSVTLPLVASLQLYNGLTAPLPYTLALTQPIGGTVTLSLAHMLVGASPPAAAAATTLVPLYFYLSKPGTAPTLTFTASPVPGGLPEVGGDAAAVNMLAPTTTASQLLTLTLPFDPALPLLASIAGAYKMSPYAEVALGTLLPAAAAPPATQNATSGGAPSPYYLSGSGGATVQLGGSVPGAAVAAAAFASPAAAAATLARWATAQVAAAPLPAGALTAAQGAPSPPASPSLQNFGAFPYAAQSLGVGPGAAATAAVAAMTPAYPWYALGATGGGSGQLAQSLYSRTPGAWALPVEGRAIDAAGAARQPQIYLVRAVGAPAAACTTAGCLGSCTGSCACSGPGTGVCTGAGSSGYCTSSTSGSTTCSGTGSAGVCACTAGASGFAAATEFFPLAVNVSADTTAPYFAQADLQPAVAWLPTTGAPLQPAAPAYGFGGDLIAAAAGADPSLANVFAVVAFTRLLQVPAVAAPVMAAATCSCPAGGAACPPGGSCPAACTTGGATCSCSAAGVPICAAVSTNYWTEASATVGLFPALPSADVVVALLPADIAVGSTNARSLLSKGLVVSNTPTLTVVQSAASAASAIAPACPASSGPSTKLLQLVPNGFDGFPAVGAVPLGSGLVQVPVNIMNADAYAGSADEGFVLAAVNAGGITASTGTATFMAMPLAGQSGCTGNGVGTPSGACISGTCTTTTAGICTGTGAAACVCGSTPVCGSLSGYVTCGLSGSGSAAVAADAGFPVANILRTDGSVWRYTLPFTAPAASGGASFAVSMTYSPGSGAGALASCALAYPAVALTIPLATGPGQTPTFTAATSITLAWTVPPAAFTVAFFTPASATVPAGTLAFSDAAEVAAQTWPATAAAGGGCVLPVGPFTPRTAGYSRPPDSWPVSAAGILPSTVVSSIVITVTAAYRGTGPPATSALSQRVALDSVVLQHAATLLNFAALLVYASDADGRLTGPKPWYDQTLKYSVWSARTDAVAARNWSAPVAIPNLIAAGSGGVALNAAERPQVHTATVGASGGAAAGSAVSFVLLTSAQPLGTLPGAAAGAFDALQLFGVAYAHGSGTWSTTAAGSAPTPLTTAAPPAAAAAAGAAYASCHGAVMQPAAADAFASGFAPAGALLFHVAAVCDSLGPSPVAAAAVPRQVLPAVVATQVIYTLVAVNPNTLAVTAAVLPGAVVPAAAASTASALYAGMPLPACAGAGTVALATTDYGVALAWGAGGGVVVSERVLPLLPPRGSGVAVAPLDTSAAAWSVPARLDLAAGVAPWAFKAGWRVPALLLAQVRNGAVAAATTTVSTPPPIRGLSLLAPVVSNAAGAAAVQYMNAVLQPRLELTGLAFAGLGTGATASSGGGDPASPAVSGTGMFQVLVTVNNTGYVRSAEGLVTLFAGTGVGGTAFSTAPVPDIPAGAATVVVVQMRTSTFMALKANTLTAKVSYYNGPVASGSAAPVTFSAAGATDACAASPLNGWLAGAPCLLSLSGLAAHALTGITGTVSQAGACGGGVGATVGTAPSALTAYSSPAALVTVGAGFAAAVAVVTMRSPVTPTTSSTLAFLQGFQNDVAPGAGVFSSGPACDAGTSPASVCTASREVQMVLTTADARAPLISTPGSALVPTAAPPSAPLPTQLALPYTPRFLYIPAAGVRLLPLYDLADAAAPAVALVTVVNVGGAAVLVSEVSDALSLQAVALSAAPAAAVSFAAPVACSGGVCPGPVANLATSNYVCYDTAGNALNQGCAGACVGTCSYGSSCPVGATAGACASAAGSCACPGSAAVACTCSCTGAGTGTCSSVSTAGASTAAACHGGVCSGACSPAAASASASALLADSLAAMYPGTSCTFAFSGTLQASAAPGALYRLTATLSSANLANFESPTSQNGRVMPLSGEGIATVGTGFLLGVGAPALQFHRTADATPLYMAVDAATVIG